MTDKTTNVTKEKCHKVKNPCKICFQRVSHKNGLRCEGACKRWVHFKCLQYTPGRIADIKAGYIKVTCPCPDCVPAEAKEFLTNPPYTCSDTTCPANQLPKCASLECRSNMEGEGAHLHLESKDETGSLLSTESRKSLPRCVAKEPRPYKLCQPTSKMSIKSSQSSLKSSRERSPNRSCKAKLIAIKDKLSASLGKLCPAKTRDTSTTTSKIHIPSTCSPKACKGSNQAMIHSASKSKPSPIPSPNQAGSKQSMTKVEFKSAEKKVAPHKSISSPGLVKKKPAKTSQSVPKPSPKQTPKSSPKQTPKPSPKPTPKSSPKPAGSKQSVTKVDFKPAGKMDAPQKSKSFGGLFGKKHKPKKLYKQKDCPVSTSDSVIEVRKGQDSLVTALDEMCKTVGRLAAQIRDIMCKLEK